MEEAAADRRAIFPVRAGQVVYGAPRKPDGSPCPNYVRDEALLPRARQAVALRRRRLRDPMAALDHSVELARGALRSGARLQTAARARRRCRNRDPSF